MIRVRRASLIEGARSATGVTVIVDVYRAFTTAAFCIAAGAREIVLVREADDAFALRRLQPDVFLTGEIGGRPIPGFDAGNSPSVIEKLDLAGRRVVQRTSAGTQGVLAAAAAGAEHILLGSLVIATATARFVRSLGRHDVTIVAMGDGVRLEPGPEDEACSDFLEDVLFSRQPRRPSSLILRPGWAEQGLPEWFPRRDAELACEIDRFDFALPVHREDGLLIAWPVRP